MASVTFPVALGGDGKTYTDDAHPDTGLDGLGYTVRFIPCLQQAVVMGLSAQSNAQAAADYVQQCQTLREEVGTDRQAVADDRTHVDQQKGLVDSAAEQVATDRQAVADDRTHVDQQKGLVDSAAQQVSTDRQAVSEDRQATEQAALAAGEAADASLQSKNDAEALYGDLQAVDTAKTQAQQAATTATEKAEEASELLADAGTAYGADAQETLTDATAGRLALVGAFGGYGSLGVTEQDNPYPLSDVDTAPLTVPNGIYAASVADIANLPFPVGATFGAIEVKHIYGDNRVKLIAYSGGVVVGQGQLEGAGEKFERIYWASIGWVGPWVNVSDVVDRGVSPDFRDSSDPVAQLLAAGSFGGYGRVGGVGYLPAYPLRNINAVPWGAVAEGNYSVAYDDGSNSFETENLPFEVTTGALEGTVKVEVLTWGVVRLTAVYEGTDPALPVGTSYERYWVRYDSQGSNWAGAWKRLGGARYREVAGLDAAPLMAQGFAGVGGTGEIVTDWNNTPNYNCFLVGSSSSLNKPPGGSVNGYQLSNSSGQYKKQFGSGINGPATYSRVCDNGTWLPWRMEYNQANVVGTVSQAGGVPTGAIIERDSNSFGSWTKYADGTMECWGHISVTTDINQTGLLTLGWRRSSSLVYDFPQTFSGDNPAVELTMSYTTTNSNVYFNILPCQFSSVNQTARFAVAFTASESITGAECRCAWRAIGRWY